MTLILWHVAICIYVRYKVKCSHVGQWATLCWQSSSVAHLSANGQDFSLYSSHHVTTDYISVYIVSSRNN